MRYPSEYQITNRRISKENSDLSPDRWFSVRITLTISPFQFCKLAEYFIILNSFFDIRYSFFIFFLILENEIA
jgi:hypothetical protein